VACGGLKEGVSAQELDRKTSALGFYLATILECRGNDLLVKLKKIFCIARRLFAIKSWMTTSHDLSVFYTFESKNA